MPKENIANQKAGKPLLILQYATGNMQRLIFQSTFPSFLACNSYAGVLLRTYQNQLQYFSFPRMFPNSSNHASKCSEQLLIV